MLAIKGLLDPENGRVGLERLVALAHCHLGLDVVYVVELTSAGPSLRAASGDLASFRLTVGASVPEDAPFSRRLLAGELPSLVADVAADPRVADLAITREASIGSFIGVPLRFSDGTLYGALCGRSHASDPTLSQRDIRFMSMLGELVIPDLDEQREREQLRADIMRLIETEGVDVAYQPIVDVRGERCLGIEALARFPEPFGAPDVTLAASRTVGLGLELERQIVTQAWQMLTRLRPAQFLALNVSPDALLELAHRANLREEVPLDQLVVEITEHAAVESYEALHRELLPLRERGLRIAVDDAGAGYASLRHVLELRPDFIKVDRSLIHGIADDHARRVAVSAFLSLALDLGSLVIAEGVERQVDLTVIRELGIHAVQGYLLAEPTSCQKALGRWIGRSPRLRERVLLGS
jgi:EAL domain-containing protein (putative c-di-GMP-specific phosphodiesterase class I)